MKQLVLLAFLLSGLSAQVQSTSSAWDKAPEAAIEQWRALRVGLFVHWGVATGRALPQSHSHARQSALNPSGSVPADVYDQYYKDFNPAHYDPDALLKLAHDAGMRYAVLVSKHHDGFSMYRSAVDPYNVMATPYGKDVAGLFADACRRQGLALGWQVSPKDWKHPDFDTDRQDRHNSYYEEVIKELATQYGPLATMWFDGTELITAQQGNGTPGSPLLTSHPAGNYAEQPRWGARRLR